MLSICEHSSEKGSTRSCKFWRCPGSGFGWAIQDHVFFHRPVSCSLAVVGTNQPWQKKKNIAGLKFVLVLLLLLEWTWPESPSALSLWKALSMCHSFWNLWNNLRQRVLEERTFWHVLHSRANPSPALNSQSFSGMELLEVMGKE